MIAEVLCERGVQVSTRDEVGLHTDVYRPSVGEFPSLLVRSLDLKTDRVAALAPALAKRGYSVVLQNVRGLGGSQGTFTPFVHEATDGADTVAWLAKRSWSNGVLGLVGAGYSTYCNYALASSQQSSVPVRCAVCCSEVVEPFELANYRGGIPADADMPWLPMRQPFRLTYDASFGHSNLHEQLNDDHAVSGGNAPPTFGCDSTDWHECAPHTTYDAYWKKRGLRNALRSLVLPTLHVSGWRDYYLGQTLAAYRELSIRGGEQRLILGPWNYTQLGDIFEEFALAEKSLRARPTDLSTVVGSLMVWLDRHLKGPSDSDSSSVRIFVTGQNAWIHEGEWPPAVEKWTKYYLAPSGHLIVENVTSSSSQPCKLGEVLPESLLEVEVARQIGLHKHDAAALIYRTLPLESASTVVGDVSAVLVISSTLPDLDIHLALFDQSPGDGLKLLRCGWTRASQRESMIRPQPLVLGTTYKMHIALGPVAHEIHSGHRLLVYVSATKVTAERMVSIRPERNITNDPAAGGSPVSEEGGNRTVPAPEQFELAVPPASWVLHMGDVYSSYVHLPFRAAH